MSEIIRIADENDLPEIVEIFNQAIRNKFSIAYINEVSMEDRKGWFSEHTENDYPILVAEENKKILGWVSISPYRKGREALKKSVEISYFIHNDHQKKGIGSRLVKEMILKTRELGYEKIIAVIFDKNTGSEKILEKNNFEKWGLLPDVAEIDGIKFSHIYYGKML